MTEAGMNLQKSLGSIFAGVVGNIPTHAFVAGEFTHPLILGNFMASSLGQSEVPLSDEQKAQIARIGAVYDDDFDRMQSNYDDNTLRLEKILDELELKRDYGSRIQESLTPEQRELIFHPDTHSRFGLDWFSPAITAAPSANPETGNEQSTKLNIPKRVSKKYGLDENQSQVVRQAYEAVASEYPELFEPEPSLNERPAADGSRRPFVWREIHLDKAITAGRAHLRMLERILEMPGVSAETRERILDDVYWLVPRVPRTE